MKWRRQRGTTLVVGMILLSLVTLLGLAGASTAHLERLLAQNGLFRENAASAASAGIESAMSRIATISAASTTPVTSTAFMPGSTDRYETVTRFTGLEPALPQVPGAQLVGAHFEITSTGFASRRAIDRQRANVMLVVAGAANARDCEPIVPVRCVENGELMRLSWQHLALE